MFGFGLSSIASRAKSSCADRGRIVPFQTSIRFMIAGTSSIMRAVASRTWANRSRLPECRMEKLPKSAACTTRPFSQANLSTPVLEWADQEDARPDELTDGMRIYCDCVRLGPGWFQDTYFGWYFVYDPGSSWPGRSPGTIPG